MKNYVTDTFTVEKKVHAASGKGHIIVKHYLGKEELNDKCGLFAEVTIPAGCSLGVHEHTGNSETYCILKGHGIYNDNGTEREIGPGDLTFTPNGFKHGLDNTNGSEDIVFTALIIND